MKHRRIIALCVALSLVGSAWAHAPRSRVSVVVGSPFVGFSPWWYASPWYYPPQPLVVAPPPPPPVYVEQAQPAGEPAEAYWYFCAESQAYYPSVSQCPAGWQRVPPRK